MAEIHGEESGGISKMLPPGEYVTITKEEYDRLIARDKILTALEWGGVEDWEWYEQSLENAGLMDDD